MPQTEGRLKQSGRLFAALAVLRLLARVDRELLTPDAAPNAKDSPEIRIRRVRGDLYEMLTAAAGTAAASTGRPHRRYSGRYRAF
ncbi:hypothetical protein [Streptomyces sp. YKOK-J1]